MRQRRLWTWLSYVLGILVVIAWAIATNAIWVVDWLERLNPPGVRTTPGLAEHIGRIYGDSRDAYGQPRVHRAVRSDSVRVLGRVRRSDTRPLATRETCGYDTRVRCNGRAADLCAAQMEETDNG